MRLVVFAVLALALAGPARAQTAQLTALEGDVQSRIGSIQALIAPIPQSAPPLVLAQIRQAQALIAQANGALATAAVNPVLGQAQLTGIDAQLMALQAQLGAVQDLIRDASFVDRELVDANRELDGARQALANAPSARAESLFAEAQDAFSQARQLERAGNLVVARQFVERSIRLSKDVEKLTVDRDEIRRRIEHVLREIDRLADLAPPNPRSTLRRRLSEANSHARIAREAYLTDQLDEVGTHLFAAEKAVKEADAQIRGLHGGPGGPERTSADQRLKAAKDTIHQVAATLGSDIKPLAARTLAGAHTYQVRAEDYFSKGIYDSAEANAHLAQRLALRALELHR